MLLYGKPVVDKIMDEQKKKVLEYFPNWDKYLAILFFWNNPSSGVYVKRKQKYWENIWFATKIFWQDNWQIWEKNEIIKLIRV